MQGTWLGKTTVVKALQGKAHGLLANQLLENCITQVWTKSSKKLWVQRFQEDLLTAVVGSGEVYYHKPADQTEPRFYLKDHAPTPCYQVYQANVGEVFKF
jgi:hypothetical protein